MSLLALTTIFALNNQLQNPSYPVELAVKSYGVVPELIPDVTPLNYIIVKYSSRLQVVLGNVFGLNQVQEEPIYVGFYACPERYYTLFMLDPDVPSRTNTSLANVRHWHVGNIPADNVTAGETLAMYMGPIPDPGTGPHRYTFLVYRQKKKLVFTEPRLLDTTGNGRTGFSLKEYVKKYNLELIAANFFQAEFGNNGCLQGFVPVVQ
ncbi:protein D2-like [Epargyreus clarus]|uniref:protein D2-like n=1 Tax=Epargyreus clarus TaxID=520877 RepID=UPI003C2ECF5F